MKFEDVIEALEAAAEPERIADYQRFFKTGKGDYGEGDIFMGVRVPKQRAVAKKFQKLDDVELQKLLKSPIHEQRLTGLFILIHKFDKAKSEQQQKYIYESYLQFVRGGYVNNWDLVDSSAHKIVGAYLFDKDRAPIYELAESGKLWQERVAVISTFWFIRQSDFEDCLNLAEYFLDHPHDLIHKATGWMLREIGKKDVVVLRDFLDQYAHEMPRTMLRYSIERLPKTERERYMNQRSK